jgi:tRNA A37 N6-isopentenylltransferase MiaA
MLEGRLAPADLRDAIVRATRAYAKRQETWFRNQLRYQPSAGSHQPEDVWTLDATRPASDLADLIVGRWRTVTADG